MYSNLYALAIRKEEISSTMNFCLLDLIYYNM